MIRQTDWPGLISGWLSTGVECAYATSKPNIILVILQSRGRLRGPCAPVNGKFWHLAPVRQSPLIIIYQYIALAALFSQFVWARERGSHTTPKPSFSCCMQIYNIFICHPAKNRATERNGQINYVISAAKSKRYL